MEKMLVFGVKFKSVWFYGPFTSRLDCREDSAFTSLNYSNPTPWVTDRL